MPVPTKSMLEKENAALKQRLAKLEKQLEAGEQAEKLLQKSEERFERTFRGNPAVQLLSRADNGRILDVNEACCRLVGRSRDELIGRNATELDFWSDSAGQQQKIQEARRAGGLGPFEVNVRHASGETRTIVASSEPIEFGGLKVFITTALEITERKRAEEALAETNAKLEKLFEVLPVGISVLDHEGRVVKENSMLENILGLSTEGLTRGDYRQRQYIRPDHTPFRAEEFPSSCILHGESAVYDVEIGVIKEDGQTVWTQVSAVAAPFSDWKVVIVTRDITERKRAEEYLQESREKYTALFEKSAMPSALTKMPEGVFADVNKTFEDVFGYIRREILGKTSVEIGMVHPDERRQTYVDMERFGFVQGSEKHFYTKAGEMRDCLINVNPVLIQGEDYVITTIIDITERRRMEESLRQARDELEMRVQQRTAELTQANAALQSSQATLQSFYDSAPFMMGIAELDGDKTVAVSANRTTANFFRMQPEDLPGQTGMELSNPEDFERLWIESYNRCQREGVPVRFEYEYPHAKGRLWFEANASFIGVGVSGNPQFSFVVEDITDRKRAENALRESEGRFRAIYEYGPVGIVLGDLKGRLTFANPAFCKLMGYEEAELLDMNFRDLTVQDDLSTENVLVDEILAGKRDHYEVEKRYIRKGGEIVWVTLSTAVVRDFYDRPLFGLAMILDITERKRMEEELRQLNESLEQRVVERTAELLVSERKFRDLAESIADVFFAFDRDLRYTYWNRASEVLTGIPARQAIGKSLYELFGDSPDTQRTEQIYREVLENRQPQTFLTEFDLLGKLHHFEISAYPFENGLSVFARDVTERRRMEEALRESEKRFERAFYGSAVAQIISLFEDGTILEVNDACCELLGYGRQELVGRTTVGMKLWGEADRRTMLAKMHQPAGLGHFEIKVRTSLGDTRFLLLSSEPIEIKGEKCLISTGVDITERKNAEQRLQEREHFISSVLNTTPAIIYVYDMEKQSNVYSNDGLTYVMGYPIEEVRDMGDRLFAALIHPDELAEVVSFQKKVMTAADGDVLISENRAKHQDGTWRILRNYESPFLRHPDGTVKQKIGVAIDITAQKQTQDELEKSHTQLQELSRRLIEAQEQERRAIGRELHDEIGQALTGLKILLEVAQRQPANEQQERIEQAQKVAGELIDHVSAISLDLRPSILDDMGLLPALLWFTNRYTSQTNVRVDFNHAGIQNMRFDTAIETAVYRLVQEALTNVARHAKVNEAMVRIAMEDAFMEIFIEDRGMGFDVKSVLALNDTSGVRGMRERVNMLMGEFQIDSAPARGTHILIRLPLVKENRE